MAKNSTIRFAIAASLCLATMASGATAQARDLLRPGKLPVFCKLYDRHEPDADVAYKPGVDAYGRPVASADLPSANQFTFPDTFSFPLTVDVIERLGLDDSHAGLEGKLGLGDVVVEQNRVSLNGEPVAGLSRADVVALCTRKPVIQ